ncbi:hypothetical protein KMW28_03350 [Flammeovirga yaeyamensis]|uniref:Lipoprotein n=1 Tax=Flammeovirga yaeyamensis TaxID=367791 RepID=A0AAX1N548_9BACT|nr:hypothetical protein [Flammeovirga yaeyamensis]MBB3701319.1 hypothetical protein [Flammeovirga yaeyamensis]NMF38212.1 hypothetical protein [Flammeovirga yaeyamensis]QWG02625.1 hypothetical protein KMW28_03350 [Flammeovirga yaeyamensis]
MLFIDINNEIKKNIIFLFFTDYKFAELDLICKDQKSFNLFFKPMRYFTFTSLIIFTLFFTSCGNEVNQEFEPIQEELKNDTSSILATDLEKDDGSAQQEHDEH